MEHMQNLTPISDFLDDLSLQLIKLFRVAYIRFRIFIQPFYFLRRPSVGFYLFCLGINIQAMLSIRLNNVHPGRLSATKISPESYPALDYLRSIENQIQLT